MVIPGFSLYTYKDEIVLRSRDSKVMNINKSSRYKLKDDLGVWRSMPLSTLKSLCKDLLKLPIGAKEVPHSGGNYFISTSGEVYSYSRAYPSGRILTATKSTSGYPVVNIEYKGSRRPVEVHQLMCVTFIDEGYIEKGLVCLHADDNKANLKLSNLSVGSYSKNNKDAYSRGLNPGNGLTKS